MAERLACCPCPQQTQGLSETLEDAGVVDSAAAGFDRPLTGPGDVMGRTVLKGGTTVGVTKKLD